MSRTCFICGKRPVVSLAVARTGSKLRSGKKRYITGKTKRRQLPNLHSVKLKIDGSFRRVRVCSRCLTSSKVQKVA